MEFWFFGAYRLITDAVRFCFIRCTQMEKWRVGLSKLAQVLAHRPEKGNLASFFSFLCSHLLQFGIKFLYLCFDVRSLDI